LLPRLGNEGTDENIGNEVLGSSPAWDTEGIDEFVRRAAAGAGDGGGDTINVGPAGEGAVGVGGEDTRWVSFSASTSSTVRMVPGTRLRTFRILDEAGTCRADDRKADCEGSGEAELGRLGEPSTGGDAGVGEGGEARANGNEIPSKSLPSPSINNSLDIMEKAFDHGLQ
jgi:hypothetical protein